MFNKLSSLKVLLFGYAFLVILYLVATVNNSIHNFYSNRTLGAFSVLIFSIIMLVGLIKSPKIFTICSVINFIVGVIIIGYLNIFVFPKFNVVLLAVFGVGVLGCLVSIKASKVARGL